jgi:hypothetical protein
MGVAPAFLPLPLPLPLVYSSVSLSISLESFSHLDARFTFQRRDAWRLDSSDKLWSAVTYSDTVS